MSRGAVVDRRDPDVGGRRRGPLDRAQDVAAVEPLRLIVDELRLRPERARGQRCEIHHVQTPGVGRRTDAPLEYDEAIVGRNRRTLDVVGQDRELPKREIAFEQVGLAARPERRIERSEEHTSELQSLAYLVCRLLLENKTLSRGPR